MSPWRIYFYIGEAFLGAAGIASIVWIAIRMVKVEKEEKEA